MRAVGQLTSHGFARLVCWIHVTSSGATHVQDIHHFAGLYGLEFCVTSSAECIASFGLFSMFAGIRGISLRR